MISLTTPSQLAEFVVRLGQGGEAFRIPLVRAAMAGDLAIAIVPRGGRLPLRLLDTTKAARRPLVILALDDDGAPSGPDGFPQARRLLRWARSVVLHGAGGLPEHYAAVAKAAGLCGRVLLVETDTLQLPEWLALKSAVAPGKAGLIIAVPPGAPPHPRNGPAPGETVQ